MNHLIPVGITLFAVAVLMTMVGKGGGNFYVLILALAGIPMHEAAATGQFILFTAALAGMFVFHKKKSVAWPLTIFMGALTAVPALAGGYFSHMFTGFMLKLIFAVVLSIAGAMMLVPVSESTTRNRNGEFGYWRFRSGGTDHRVNLWMSIPISLAAGFFSGMVGVSGGSFLVPLMVLACEVPMHVAVGTASTLIAVTSFMGFAGHAAQGDFNPVAAIPLAIITIAGGFAGGRLALKTKPAHLKYLFAYTTWLASLFMVLNAYWTK